MLVVTSNWGLCDGSLAGRPPGGLAPLLAAIHGAVMRAGLRRDGTYRPVDEVDLVLAGDTFDWLTTDAWCGPLRPWQAGQRARAARLAVSARTMWAAREVVGRLARWVRRGLPVSAADARGRPDWATTHRVPVRLTLLAGDRDPWLADVAAPTGRHPFGAGLCWTDGTSMVRHGHDLDPACRGDGGAARDRCGRPPTLAESVAVDLLVPFAVGLRSRETTWRVVRPLIHVLAANRPVDLPFRLAEWAAAASERGAGGMVRGVIEPAWRRAVAAWAGTARRSAPSSGADFDASEALAAVLDTGLGHADVARAAALRQRLAPAAERGPGMRFIGHPPGPGPRRFRPGSALETTAAAGGPSALVIRVDEAGATHRERLAAAGVGPAVVTIAGARPRRAAGGLVVDAA